jgi:hypothetical protein
MIELFIEHGAPISNGLVERIDSFLEVNNIGDSSTYDDNA